MAQQSQTWAWVSKRVHRGQKWMIGSGFLAEKGMTKAVGHKGCANPGEGQTIVGWWGVEGATSQKDKSHLEYSAKGQAKCYWEWFFVCFCFALDFWRQGLEVRQKDREIHWQEEKKPLTRVWLKPLISWKSRISTSWASPKTSLPPVTF